MRHVHTAGMLLHCLPPQGPGAQLALPAQTGLFAAGWQLPKQSNSATCAQRLLAVLLRCCSSAATAPVYLCIFVHLSSPERCGCPLVVARCENQHKGFEDLLSAAEY